MSIQTTAAQQARQHTRDSAGRYSQMLRGESETLPESAPLTTVQVIDRFGHPTAERVEAAHRQAVTSLSSNPQLGVPAGSYEQRTAFLESDPRLRDRLGCQIRPGRIGADGPL